MAAQDAYKIVRQANNTINSHFRKTKDRCRKYMTIMKSLRKRGRLQFVKCMAEVKVSSVKKGIAYMNAHIGECKGDKQCKKVIVQQIQSMKAWVYREEMAIEHDKTRLGEILDVYLEQIQ